MGYKEVRWKRKTNPLRHQAEAPQQTASPVAGKAEKLGSSPNKDPKTTGKASCAKYGQVAVTSARKEPATEPKLECRPSTKPFVRVELGMAISTQQSQLTHGEIHPSSAAGR
jgi:hypothetical protein